VGTWLTPRNGTRRQPLRRCGIRLFTLIAMGTGVAWLFSVVATLAPGIFPDSFRDMGTVDVYFEAADVITVLVLLGQVLELRAREQTSGAIKALLDLTPKTAHRIVRGGDEEVDLGQVQIASCPSGLPQPAPARTACQDRRATTTARPRTMGCRADDEVKGGSASASDAAIACCARFGGLRSLCVLVHEDL